MNGAAAACLRRFFPCVPCFPWWVFLLRRYGGCGWEGRTAEGTEYAEGCSPLVVMDRRNLVQKKHSYGKCGSQHAFSYEFCGKSCERDRNHFSLADRLQIVGSKSPFLCDIPTVVTAFSAIARLEKGGVCVYTQIRIQQVYLAARQCIIHADSGKSYDDPGLRALDGIMYGKTRIVAGATDVRRLVMDMSDEFGCMYPEFNRKVAEMELTAKDLGR